MNYNNEQIIDLKKNFWQYTDEARIAIARKLLDDNYTLQFALTTAQEENKRLREVLKTIVDEFEYYGNGGVSDDAVKDAQSALNGGK